MPATDYLVDGPASAPLTVVLAHGAGAPMDSEFMNSFAAGVATLGYRCVRFEFPYMADRRKTGVKKPPNRQPILLETWRAVIDDLGVDKLVIGGKSMGGRMATLIADDAGVGGCVALGYPFYGMGRADKPRIEHLKTLTTPTLICQGTRDTMGNYETVSALKLSNAINIHWAEDGDHSLKPRKKSGRTEDQTHAEALSAIEHFLSGLQK